MYAIIEDSGTQIKVTPGQIVDVDLRTLDEGASSIDFGRVLMVGGADDDSPATVGRPYVDGASVSAEILDEVAGEKIDVFKFKRRKGYRRKIGHRQRFLRVRIKDINVS